MRVLKAMYAFYKQLFFQSCTHERVTKDKSGSFCPDCGYQVKVIWNMLRCRTCGTKRHPRQELDGVISPIFKYCQHCGGHDVQLLKRHKINAHEMGYAIAIKEIDYTESKPLSAQEANARYGHCKNPFENLGHTPRVVNGEVLKKTVTLTPGR